MQNESSQLATSAYWLFGKAKNVVNSTLSFLSNRIEAEEEYSTPAEPAISITSPSSTLIINEGLPLLSNQARLDRLGLENAPLCLVDLYNHHRILNHPIRLDKNPFFTIDLTKFTCHQNNTKQPLINPYTKTEICFIAKDEPKAKEIDRFLTGLEILKQVEFDYNIYRKSLSANLQKPLNFSSKQAQLREALTILNKFLSEISSFQIFLESAIKRFEQRSHDAMMSMKDHIGRELLESINKKYQEVSEYRNELMYGSGNTLRKSEVFIETKYYDLNISTSLSRSLTNASLLSLRMN